MIPYKKHQISRPNLYSRKEPKTKEANVKFININLFISTIQFFYFLIFFDHALLVLQDISMPKLQLKA